MSLSEGKMFTIEALNRIEGFVWPKGAEFAAFSATGTYVGFYKLKPSLADTAFDGHYMQGMSIIVPKTHPDWRNSLITREEFESVDGWVNNGGGSMHEQADEKRIDYIMRSGHSFVNCRANDLDWAVTNHQDDIMKWRYHKPQKQEVKPEPESIETMIRRYKDAKENKRAAIDKINQAKSDVEQAEALEDSLFMAIEAWGESHGFDIRMLSEIGNAVFDDGVLSSIEYPAGFHIPNPVITDWRDLQVGDLVAWIVGSYRGEFTVHELYPDNEGGNPCAAIMAANGKQYNVYPDEIKFIRRPEKK